MHTGQNIFKFKCIYIELFVMLTDIRTYIHLCQKKKTFFVKNILPINSLQYQQQFSRFSSR